MGIWNTFWRGFQPQTKEFWISKTQVLQRPDEPSHDTHALQRAMTTNELVYACLMIKAQALRDPRLIVQKRKRNGEWEEWQGHPLRRLMMEPNPLMDEGDLMAACLMSWETTKPRRAYIEKEYDGALLVGLWPLNPAYMSEEQRGDMRVYVWNDGKDRTEFTADQLIIRQAPSWWYPSGLASAMGSVDGDQSQTDYVRAFFKNGGVPSGILKVRGVLQQPQADDLRARWRAKYSLKSGLAGDVAVLDDNADYQKIGSAIGELENEELRAITESRICMALGVPPLIVYAYVGLLRATYSNLREAWKSFWDSTMSPALKEWRSFFQRALLPEYHNPLDITNERVRLAYDLSMVAAMQEDVTAIEGRAIALYQAGLAKRNEARSRVNLDPVDEEEGGEQFKASGDKGNSEQIFGYHITEGVVDINEARERVNLAPRDDGGRSLRLRALQSQFSAIKAMIDTGVPLSAALEVAEVDEQSRNTIQKWLTNQTPPSPPPQAQEADRVSPGI